MNTIVTIALCLLASAVLQGIGFYIYSIVYRKKHSATLTHSNADSAVEAAPTNHLITGHIPAAYATPFSYTLSVPAKSNHSSIGSPIVFIKPNGLKKQATK